MLLGNVSFFLTGFGNTGFIFLYAKGKILTNALAPNLLQPSRPGGMPVK
jgi:hypothetical protein